jgi:hypothetical protein
VLKFRPAFARNLRRLRSQPSDLWHMDKMVVPIQGKRMPESCTGFLMMRILIRLSTVQREAMNQMT